MGGRGASSGGRKTIKNAQGKEVPYMDHVPKGWKENTYATTAPKGYTWIDNGKSHFDKDYKSAIVPESALSRANSNVIAQGQALKKDLTTAKSQETKAYREFQKASGAVNAFDWGTSRTQEKEAAYKKAVQAQEKARKAYHDAQAKRSSAQSKMNKFTKDNQTNNDDETPLF